MKHSIRPSLASSLIRTTVLCLFATAFVGCGGNGGSDRSFLPKPPYAAPETLSTSEYTGNASNPDAAPKYRNRIVTARFTQNGNQVHASMIVRTTDDQYARTTSYNGIIAGSTLYLQATGSTGNSIPGHDACDGVTMILNKVSGRDAYEGTWTSTSCPSGGYVSIGVGQIPNR